MKDDVNELVIKRCELALMENEEYLKLERSDTVDDAELIAMASETCYKKGFYDGLNSAMNIIRKCPDFI